MTLREGISIVICTYNGKNRLQPTLESIFKQVVASDISWELIIIDNASTDETSEFCKQIIEKNKFSQPYKIITEPQQGCNHARLRGLQEIQYKWLLFCDDDNHLFPEYLQKGWEILNSHSNIGVLGGQGIPLFESQQPDWFGRYAASFAIGPQYKKNGVLPKNEKRKLYSAGSFFNATGLFLYYEKGFNTVMTGPKANELTRGEDTEWCIMLQLLGLDLVYVDELKFYHFMTTSRLQWSYYLTLKKGIASGAATISSYDSFVKNKKYSSFTFVFYYLFRLLYAYFILFQFNVRKRITPSRYAREEVEIGNQVNSATAKSYLRDFKIAYRHFTQLKEFYKKYQIGL